MAVAARIVAAFALAPLLPTLVLAFALAKEGQYLRILILTAAVAYGLTLVFGVPLFLWLGIWPGRVTLKRVLTCSFLVGAVPLAVLGLMAPGSTTANRPWGIVGLPMLIGLLSLAGGAIFWHITSSALTMSQGSEREV
jgi:hypothetical protein